MSESLAARLRRTASFAEAAAVAGQHAEISRPHGEPSSYPADWAIIAGLQFAAEHLYEALEALNPFPYYPRRTVIQTLAVLGGWLVPGVSLLLLVPNPSQPWVLVAALVGCSPLGTLTGTIATAIEDRRSAGQLATIQAHEPTRASDATQDSDATQTGDAIQAVTAELRAQLAAITTTLKPDRDPAHRTVATGIENAEVWLNTVEQAVSRSGR